MVSVPDDVWTQVVYFAQKYSVNCCGVLTRISKQLHRVTHQKLTKLEVNFIQCGVTSQYSGLTQLNLHASKYSRLELPAMKNLEVLVFKTYWKKVDLLQLSSQHFPLLKTLKFGFTPTYLYMKNGICKQITKLSLYYYHIIFDLDMFPNLTNLSCYKVCQIVPFISKLEYFKVKKFTQATFVNLLEFEGTFVFNKIEYQVSDGFILKTKEDGSIEKIHPIDERLPFKGACSSG